MTNDDGQMDGRTTTVPISWPLAKYGQLKMIYIQLNSSIGCDSLWTVGWVQSANLQSIS